MRRRGGPPPRGHFGRPYPPPPPPNHHDGFGPPPSPPWERRDPYGYPPSPPPPPPGPPRGWYDRPLTPPPPWARDKDLPPPPPPRHPPPSSFADDDFFPPPFHSNGPPRGRGRGDGQGSSQSRGRGDASSSRGGNQGRGSATRGRSSGRGVNPTRGAGNSRGASRGGVRGTNAARGMANRGVANGRGGNTSNRGKVNWLDKARGGAQTGNVKNNSSQFTDKTENAPKTANPNNFQSYAMLNKAKKEQKKAENTVLKAAIPGQLNFISFKNSLQECCQKQQLPVPAYKSWKASYGYSAKVEVAGNTFQSTGIQGDQKEAQQNAAYNALVGLGLIDSTVSFDVKTAAAVKRPAIDNSVTENATSKRIKLDSSSPAGTSYKSRLNEFCQKFRLSLPSYDTVRTETGKGFITTIVFNKKVHQSNGPQPTKKLSEQNAAQVVLHMLNQCPAPPPSCQDFVEHCKQLASQSSSSSGTSTSLTSLTTTVAVEQIPLPSAPAPGATAQTIPASTVQNTASSTATRFSSPIVEKIATPVTQPSGAATAIAKPQTTFTSHKNSLQEYCQKSKIAMPVYFSHRENGVFTCTVHVAGVSYTSTSCNTKKGSEQTAASVALKALGLV